MEKILTIISCNECRYLNHVNSTCRHKRTNGNYVALPSTIPNWCPLEDDYSPPKICRYGAYIEEGELRLCRAVRSNDKIELVKESSENKCPNDVCENYNSDSDSCYECGFTSNKHKFARFHKDECWIWQGMELTISNLWFARSSYLPGS